MLDALNESDAWSTFITRDELIDAAKKKVTQKYYNQIFVDVYCTDQRYFSSNADIPWSIIDGAYPPAAAPFIAADVLIGFPQLSSC